MVTPPRCQLVSESPPMPVASCSPQGPPTLRWCTRFPIPLDPAAQVGTIPYCIHQPCQRASVDSSLQTGLLQLAPLIKPSAALQAPPLPLHPHRLAMTSGELSSNGLTFGRCLRRWHQLPLAGPPSTAFHTLPFPCSHCFHPIARSTVFDSLPSTHSHHFNCITASLASSTNSKANMKSCSPALITFSVTPPVPSPMPISGSRSATFMNNKKT
jgi:hypothetical protein